MEICEQFDQNYGLEKSIQQNDVEGNTQMWESFGKFL